MMNRFTQQLYAASLALAMAPAGLLLSTAQAAAETREFHIVTVHHDGVTTTKGDANHSAEAFPDKPFASGSGMWVKGPQPNGEWQARAFVFNPAQVTVQQGDEVRLVFVGVHGGSHIIAVDGVEKPVAVKRGTTQTVTFKAEKPGIISFSATDRTPSMKGQVVVLPRF